jgi:cytidylate kinase
MIIGISGPTASGKTTIANMLATKLDAFRIRYSDILSQIAYERGLDANDKATLQALYLSERKEKGEDFLARALEEKVMGISSPNIIIEGNRRLVDIDTLRRIAEVKQDRLLLLFIDASLETRFARYNGRLQKHDELPISYEAFMELEANGAENELPELREIFAQKGLHIDGSNRTPEQIFAEIAEYFQI